MSGFISKTKGFLKNKSPSTRTKEEKEADEDAEWFKKLSLEEEPDKAKPGFQPNEEEAPVKRSGEETGESLALAQARSLNNKNEWTEMHQKIESEFSHTKREASFSSQSSTTTWKRWEMDFEALKMKINGQDEVLARCFEENDELGKDSKAMSTENARINAEFEQSKAESEKKNLEIAKLQRELSERKANIEILQERDDKFAVEMVGQNERIKNLEQELKGGKRTWNPVRDVSTSTDDAFDTDDIKSVRVRDTATEKEEILELKSTNAALEREINTLKELHQRNRLKGEQDSNHASKKISELEKEFADLSDKNLLLETKLAGDKEYYINRLEGMEKQLKRLKLELIESKGNFRSWMRIRPPQGGLPEKDIKVRGGDTVELVTRNGIKREFTFDRVFEPQHNNATVFQDLSEILEAALQGYDITVLAYGQTGSGKTYTMSSMLDMALEQMFTQLNKSYGNQYSVKGRCIEVHEGKVYDLLVKGREKVKVTTGCTGMWPVREETLPVKTQQVENLDSVQEIVKEANNNRTSGQTVKNDTSSRSHMFMSFQVQGSRTEESGAITTTRSGITFIDLAGSESIKQVEGRPGETKSINTELSALKTVLKDLGESKKVITWGPDQLIRLLKDGFTGGKVLFIQAASLGELEESIHTMDFGSLVSKVMQKKPAKSVVTEFTSRGGVEKSATSSQPIAPSTRGAGTSSSRSGTYSRGAPVTSAPRGSSGARGTFGTPRGGTRK